MPWPVVRGSCPKSGSVRGCLAPLLGKHLLGVRTLSGSPTSSGSQWRIGCWNQHRVGSYAQRNCPWVPRLRALGFTREELDGQLTSLAVEYEALELQAWVACCDVVALQEVDEALRQVLRTCPASQPLVESSRHVDGRGVEVDCTVAVHHRAQVSLLSRAHAELRMPLSSNRFGRAGAIREAVRDHVVVLLNKGTPGDEGGTHSQLLLLCSVHLHPPSSIDASGVAYLTYLEPLKVAITSLAAERLPGPAACALVGDFNISPQDFCIRTAGDPFWSPFSIVSSGGVTAHGSNPCEVGDFGIFRMLEPGSLDLQGADAPGNLPIHPSAADSVGWSCHAHGDSDFRFFEQFSDSVVSTVGLRLRMQRAQQDLKRACDNIQRALSGLGTNLPQLRRQRPAPPPGSSYAPPLPPGPPPPVADDNGTSDGLPPDEVRHHPLRRPAPPPPPALQRDSAALPLTSLPSLLGSSVSELSAINCRLSNWQSSLKADGCLRKGLQVSDHRPLVFESR